MGSQKKLRKVTQGRAVAARKMMSLKKILCTFLSANRILRFCFSRGSDNYIEQQRKLSQGAICASGIAISADAKHCNSIILSTWFVKTCICGIKVREHIG